MQCITFKRVQSVCVKNSAVKWVLELAIRNKEAHCLVPCL